MAVELSIGSGSGRRGWGAGLGSGIFGDCRAQARATRGKGDRSPEQLGITSLRRRRPRPASGRLARELPHISSGGLNLITEVRLRNLSEANSAAQSASPCTAHRRSPGVGQLATPVPLPHSAVDKVQRAADADPSRCVSPGPKRERPPTFLLPGGRAQPCAPTSRPTDALPARQPLTSPTGPPQDISHLGRSSCCTAALIP